MKKLIILTVALLALNLTGCKIMLSDNTNDISAATTTQEEVASSTEDPLPGFMGNSQLTIESYEKCTNANGQDVVIITFNFRNLSSEPMSFAGSLLDVAVFQNGTELSEAFSSDEIPSNISYELFFENNSLEVMPGYSISFQCAYILKDSSPNITVYVDKYFDDYHKLQYEIEI